jgi:hypothetical protein
MAMPILVAVPIHVAVTMSVAMTMAVAVTLASKRRGGDEQGRGNGRAKRKISNH